MGGTTCACAQGAPIGTLCAGRSNDCSGPVNAQFPTPNAQFLFSTLIFQSEPRVDPKPSTRFEGRFLGAGSWRLGVGNRELGIGCSHFRHALRKRPRDERGCHGRRSLHRAGRTRNQASFRHRNGFDHASRRSARGAIDPNPTVLRHRCRAVADEPGAGSLYVASRRPRSAQAPDRRSGSGSGRRHSALCAMRSMQSSPQGRRRSGVHRAARVPARASQQLGRSADDGTADFGNHRPDPAVRHARTREATFDVARRARRGVDGSIWCLDRPSARVADAVDREHAPDVLSQLCLRAVDGRTRPPLVPVGTPDTRGAGPRRISARRAAR